MTSFVSCVSQYMKFCLRWYVFLWNDFVYLHSRKAIIIIFELDCFSMARWRFLWLAYSQANTTKLRSRWTYLSFNLLGVSYHPSFLLPPYFAFSSSLSSAVWRHALWLSLMCSVIRYERGKLTSLKLSRAVHLLLKTQVMWSFSTFSSDDFHHTTWSICRLRLACYSLSWGKAALHGTEANTMVHLCKSLLLNIYCF